MNSEKMGLQTVVEPMGLDWQHSCLRSDQIDVAQWLRVWHGQ